jgi:hypothetical protein
MSSALSSMPPARDNSAACPLGHASNGPTHRAAPSEPNHHRTEHPPKAIHRRPLRKPTREPAASSPHARSDRAWLRVRAWLCAVLLSASARAQAAPDVPQPQLPLLAAHVPDGSRVGAGAAELAAASAPVHSIFHIAKSENRNQVHYAARVDERCRPVGASPVYAYWRMREHGPRATEPLLDREQPGYGLQPQQLVERNGRGGSVRVRLRVWPDHPLTIELFPAANGCAARALTDLHHQPTIIRSIYIELGFLFSINYAQLKATRLSDGRAITEKLEL